MRTFRSSPKKVGGAATIDTMMSALAEHIPANIMAADANFKLVFLNKFAQKTLQGLDQEIRSAFRLGSDELLGGSIHRVHRNPERVEAILRNPDSFPHRATLRFGDVALRSTINAIWGDGGRVLGYVVIWESVAATERKAQELTSDLSAVASAASNSAGLVAANSVNSSSQADLVAAAAEEMSASIGEISSRMNQAAAATMRGVETTSAVTSTIEELNADMKQISGLVTFIEGVASQTNLLALNATIESARAGEAGKGFAVVASEVKSLAQQVAEATHEIRTKVHAIEASAMSAERSIQELSLVVNEISEQQSGIAAAVEEQSATAAEMTRSIGSVASTSHALKEIAEELETIATQVEVRTGDLKTLLLDQT